MNLFTFVAAIYALFEFNTSNKRFRCELHASGMKIARLIAAVVALETISFAKFSSPIIVGNHSSWVGDVWVPPWRLYNITEIVAAMQGQRIAIFGDSLNRRLTATLADLIMASMNGSGNIRDLDSELGNGAHDFYDWSPRINASGVAGLHYTWLPISHEMRAYLSGDEGTRKGRPTYERYSILIFSAGVHNAEKQIGFGEMELAKKLCELAMANEDKLFIWRSAPYSKSWDQPSHDMT